MSGQLKERITKLVQGLLVEPDVKESLLDAVEKNPIDSKLLEKIKFFIDQATVDYEAQAEKQIAKIREDLNATLANLDKEFGQIEQDTKQHQKDLRHEQDQEQLEEIRKKINQG